VLNREHACPKPNKKQREKRSNKTKKEAAVVLSVHKCYVQSPTLTVRYRRPKLKFSTDGPGTLRPPRRRRPVALAFPPRHRAALAVMSCRRSLSSSLQPLDTSSSQATTARRLGLPSTTSRCLSRHVMPLGLSFPLLQLPRAERRRRELPAAIPPAPFLSGGRLGTGEGGGPGNRRADVDRVTRYLSRVRFCSPSVTVGGARSCHGVMLLCGSLFLVAMVATTQVNNFSRPLPRPGAFLLRRHRRGRGEPFRSPRSSAYRRLREAAVPATLFVQGAGMVVGFVAGWRVDRARASLGDCQRRF
jgi:hypothetical protein